MSGQKQIEGPFQSYVTERTMTFAEWLLGFRGPIQGVENYKYGKFSPAKDFFKDFMRTGKQKSQLFNGIRKNTTFKNALIKKVKYFKEQEQSLYRAIKCKNFEDFNKIWSNLQWGDDNVEKWLLKDFSLLEGEYQRIFADKGFTLFEQVMSLYRIDFEKHGIEGFSNDFKSKIRDYLLGEEDSIIGRIKEPILQRQENISKRGNKQIVYIPTKQYYYKKKKKVKNKTKTVESVDEGKFFKDIGEAIKQMFKAVYTEDTKRRFSKSVKEVVDYANSEKFNLKVREKRYNRTSLDSCFAKITFGGTTRGKNFTIGDAINQILGYLEKVKKTTYSPDEWNEWKAVSKKDKKAIEARFKLICREFFKKEDFNGEEKLSQVIQGKLGELAAYGRSRINLKEEQEKYNLKIFHIGDLKNMKKELAAADLILQVNNRNYGIQVKNPFETLDGYYETYKKKWNLGSAKSRNELYDYYLNLNENEIDIFNFLQVNLNNLKVNSQTVQKGIETFLRYYTLEFARLDLQEIEMPDKMREDFKQGLVIDNLFFVLKGELIQTSAILSGILKQYEILEEGLEQNWRQYDLTHKMNISYRNNIEKNFKSIGGFSQNIKYQPEWINQDIDSLLKDVSIKTSLQLQIPSLSELGVLRRRRKREGI